MSVRVRIVLVWRSERIFFTTDSTLDIRGSLVRGTERGPLRGAMSKRSVNAGLTNDASAAEEVQFHTRSHGRRIYAVISDTHAWLLKKHPGPGRITD